MLADINARVLRHILKSISLNATLIIDIESTVTEYSELALFAGANSRQSNLEEIQLDPTQLLLYDTNFDIKL